MKVLIVGNGISRLDYYDFIFNWKDEIWICNDAFLEFGNIATRYMSASMPGRAYEYKEKYDWRFQILMPPDSSFDMVPHIELTTDRGFWNDCGTSLVAQALEEGYEVSVIGFDLGGLEIHRANNERLRKDKWVQRWRDIAEYYGLENVTFIGYDHKPYIEGEEGIFEYSALYKSYNKPHIDTEGYKQLHKRFTEMRKIDPNFKGDNYRDYAIPGVGKNIIIDLEL